MGGRGAKSKYKEEIERMLGEGYRPSAIAARLGCSHSLVTKFSHTGRETRPARQKRPGKAKGPAGTRSSSQRAEKGLTDHQGPVLGPVLDELERAPGLSAENVARAREIRDDPLVLAGDRLRAMALLQKWAHAGEESRPVEVDEESYLEMLKDAVGELSPAQRAVVVTLFASALPEKRTE